MLYNVKENDIQSTCNYPYIDIYLSYAVYGRSLVAVSDTDCVDNCTGKNNTDYQSCFTCNGYVTCSNAQLFNMTCPASLLWDDHLQLCNYKSNTCDPSYINFKNNQGKPMRGE